MRIAVILDLCTVRRIISFMLRSLYLTGKHRYTLSKSLVYAPELFWASVKSKLAGPHVRD
jgi:hypothetical protein